MTEKNIPELFNNEKFQLLNSAISLCVGKAQICAATGDSMGVNSASKWAVNYYDQAFDMVKDQLERVEAEQEEKERDNGETTVQLRTNMDTSRVDEPGSGSD